MGTNLFEEEYKNMKAVDVVSFNCKIINTNHDICESKKALKCLKRIKKTQLKYRVHRRKKLNYSILSNQILDEFAKAYNKVVDENLPRKEMSDALNQLEIMAYELALVNDSSREYEYDKRIDEGIKIYKNDIRLLKKQKRQYIYSKLIDCYSNYKLIKKLNKMDEESLESHNERRILRKYLR